MNTPDLIAKQFVPGEPTAPYQSSSASPGGARGRTKVAIIAGSGPRLTSEIETLLRKRLRILTLIWLVVLALSGTGILVRLGRTTEVIWFYLVPVGVMLMTTAGLWGLLLSRKQISLGRLRAIELIEFGILTVGFSCFQYSFLRAWLPIYAARGPIELEVLATFASYMPSLLIFAYGIFIPNTWRRCSVVVGVMVLTALAFEAAVGLFDGTIEGRLLASILSKSGFLVAIAAALAIFGSHRIEVLRQQASEARKLGQYQLKEHLGTGGMGEVYLAEPLLLRRPCAIKLIRPERAGDPNALRRFEREVQAMATLTHPNTVQIFDYGHAEDGTFYYVMEYLPGLSLEQLVHRHGPIPTQRTVHFLQQICGALGEAHAIGLIHRDIKSGNILICERGGVHDVVKLLDFGLVLAPGVKADGANLTQEGDLAGTPAYMSPEQAGGQEDLDPRSDIYSLGAVAYFLLTGQPPFAGRSPAKMVAAHIYEPPAPLSNHRADVSEDLQAVVLRCLAKDPADRFADVQRIEIALAECHTTGQWCEKQAADWWRFQASPSGKVVSDKGNSEPGLTRRCT